MPQMFQQALWVDASDQEDQGQQVDLLKSTAGAALKKEARPLSLTVITSVSLHL
jgi:hypothetical protein